MKKVAIITSATYNIQIERGAYGCYIITEDKILRNGESYVGSSVPRLELIAIISALEDLRLVYPDTELQIEICSRQTYITSAFTAGKLRQNLSRGTSLINYDLWKKIFELGKMHQWKPTPIKTTALDNLHKRAAALAHESVNDEPPIVDEGIDFSSRKRKISQTPVFDIEDINQDSKPEFESNNTTAEETQVDKQKGQNQNDGSRSGDHPIIENNDPPF